MCEGIYFIVPSVHDELKTSVKNQHNVQKSKCSEAKITAWIN